MEIKTTEQIKNNDFSPSTVKWVSYNDLLQHIQDKKEFLETLDGKYNTPEKRWMLWATELVRELVPELKLSNTTVK